MPTVYLGIGTNLGNKEQNIKDAVHNMEEQIGKVISLSALYVTKPWGFASDNDFLNAVVCIETELNPHQAMIATQSIEREMGRIAKSVNKQYKDRIIDIDILLYDDNIINDADLIIPHPLMTQRLFVMEPLCEIAPDLIHPVLKQSIKELLISLQQ